MKFSVAALAMGMAPVVLAKSVHNVAPVVRRDGHKSTDVSVNSIKATDAQIAELTKLFGLHQGDGRSINFLWVNIGGGAATTVVGSTVTVTQTVVGGAATAPPAVVTGEAPTATDGGAVATSVAGGAAATHTVTVGGPKGLSFEPQQLKAAVGDSVVFTFLSQNHTVTQSAFDTPCDPLAGGMDSGFQANANNTVNPPPQVAMQVMVDTPLWFYCRQGNHCGKGMVFSINPSAAKTHAMFQSLAIQQKGNLAGGAITGNGPAVDPNASASASVSLAVPTATASAGGAANTGVVSGVGQVGADGTCICAVQCSFSGFPNAAVQGRDSFGGYGGAIDMAMVGAAPAKKFRA
ncbi:Plastocyanin, chloroplastic [Cladorrhinum samala]|uniref:Plastocyanin, chloroplastic n=1 Tax=Cladorrhinum samala TaxID=585594 RepID=A0AAV9HBQ6_9PEZI|nr:Plastocyanin, chloroplastic [Cladorrhinum samala]